MVIESQYVGLVVSLFDMLRRRCIVAISLYMRPRGQGGIAKSGGAELFFKIPQRGQRPQQHLQQRAQGRNGRH